MTRPAEGATADCTPADPPPRVLSVQSDDVTLLPSSRGFTDQPVHVTVQSACGGSSSYLQLRFRRSGQVGEKGRACAVSTSSDYIDSGAGPVATSQPDVYDHPLSKPWSFDANDDYGTPATTSACAGPWDIVATPYNTFKMGDTSTTTKGAPFTAKAVFSFFRGSRLTTNVSPEPVRRGATVTVKGRLTRQAMAPDRLSTGARDKYIAFAGEPVGLQRRTLSGTYNNIRTVRSNRDGYLTTKLKALPEDRCYRWVYRGSDTTLRVTAGGDCIHVRR
ncbi:hypothetical protein KRR39_08315 [Nocardioides panacis]|jgi:hypothetical protein|uniref:Uncharacterized protein n=1 Tax=Nocardioides panacis TaxID=2849501 RepID=A0A975Y1P3_9ACTN|nr:hypothetical protein [Nocardioides panacis]QWZ09727.1 hypothetical protein KRR39_08315 [Nocardioides panacis]